MTNNTKNETKKFDIGEFFSEIGNSGRLSIERVEPDWAKGHIRTIDVTDSETLSADYIKENFGGTKIRLTLFDSTHPGAQKNGYVQRRTFNISSVPKDGFGNELVRGQDGVAITKKEFEAQERKDMMKLASLQGQAAMNQQAQQIPAQPAQPMDMTAVMAPMTTMMTSLMQMMLQQNKAQSDMVTGLLANRVQESTKSPGDMMQETLNMFMQLDKMRSDIVVPPQQEESFDLMKSVQPVLEMVMQSKAAADQKKSVMAQAKVAENMKAVEIEKRKRLEVEQEQRQLQVSRQAPVAELPASEQIANGIDTGELFQMIPHFRQALANMDDNTRNALIDGVLGDYVEPEDDSDYDYDDENIGQQSNSTLESNINTGDAGTSATDGHSEPESSENHQSDPDKVD